MNEKFEAHPPVLRSQRITRASYDIGILFFNRARQTLECVLSFLDEELQPDVVILDQGSSADQRKFLNDALAGLSNVRFVSLRQNIGVAAGRNRICRECLSDWVLFVDSDITLNTRGGVALINSMVRDASDVDGISPRIFNVHENLFADRLRITGTPGRDMSEQPHAGNEITNIFPGGAVVLRRSVLMDNPYDEGYFVGFEDYEFALRAFSEGRALRIKPLDEVTLAHKHLPAISEPDVTSTLVRYSDRLIDRSFESLKKAYGGALFPEWKKWVADQRSEMLDGRPVAARVPKDGITIAVVGDEANPPSGEVASALRRESGSGVNLTTVCSEEPGGAGLALRKVLDADPQLIHFVHRASFLQMIEPRAIAQCAALLGVSAPEILDRFCQSQMTFSAGDRAFLTPADIRKFRPFYWLSDGYCITSSRLSGICERNSDCPKPAALIPGDAQPTLSWPRFFAEIVRSADPAGPQWRRLMIEKFYLAVEPGC